MKAISYKTSARQRTPQVSMGSGNRVKALRSVGSQQLMGANPVWYVDYRQTKIAEGSALDQPPQRKGPTWSVNGPANRAAWTSDGMEFAGAQSYIRGTGDDINGQTQLTIISVTRPQDQGQIVETQSGTGFWTVRGLLHAINPSSNFIQSEGPFPTNFRNYVGGFNRWLAYGSYWDTANPDPNLTELASVGGEVAEVVAIQLEPKGTPFSSNNLYIGSRSSGSLFFQGRMKAVLFFQGENSQQELNNLTRVAQWSVK